VTESVDGNLYTVVQFLITIQTRNNPSRKQTATPRRPVTCFISASTPARMLWAASALQRAAILSAVGPLHTSSPMNTCAAAPQRPAKRAAS